MPHEEVAEPVFDSYNHYKTILPQQLDLITYPYEWCFEQWKAAALHTLSILNLGLQHGMILKDATPFNVQFQNCKPVFIDTLSFEIYKEGEPWIAYKQFCEMFLAPLSLMSYVDTSLHRLLLMYPAGVPVATAAKMLPFRSKFSSGLLLHIHLHASLSERHKTSATQKALFSRSKLLSIINSLEATITKLRCSDRATTWSKYYSETILTNNYLAEKEQVIKKLLSSLQTNVILDIGANDGYFSSIAAKYSTKVIAIDSDERSINRLYKQQSVGKNNIDVLVADLANPSPAIGALLNERTDLPERLKGDVVMALAVIHHLVITNNFTMQMAAELFAGMGDLLIIEFPLPEDEKVKLISTHVKQLDTIYSLQKFKDAFNELFEFQSEIKLESAPRVIYLLKRRITK